METLALYPLFDELPDGICISDEAGQILYMNPAAERLLGTRLSEMNGKNFCETLCGHLETAGSKECASTCPLRRRGDETRAVTYSGRHGPRRSFEWQDFHIKRREIWSNLRIRCLKAKPADLPDGQERHLTLIEDAGPQLELERNKEDWRSMVAHDIRNPVQNVFATLRLLQDKGPGKPLEEGESNLIDISVRSCGRMMELLELYLEVAKLDAGAMSVKLEPIALLETVKKCVEEQSASTQARRLAVTIEIDPSLRVRTDAELLPRIVQNLLGNAVKFTQEGGSITLTARGAAGRVALAIRDTGPGIPPQDLPLIFDRFHQAEARRAGRIQGVGLGLTFCREALKAMGGSISVSSEPGRGSEFTVELPAASSKKGG